MNNRAQGEAPCSQELVHALQGRLNYQWVDDGCHEPWELRFIFQLIERDHQGFKINIAIVANRNGTPQDLQHVVYLELVSVKGQLLLGWSQGVNHTSNHMVDAFKTIYPLEQMVSDIQIALRAYPVEVVLPEIIAAQAQLHLSQLFHRHRRAG
ncbi:MAG: hypothetical protein V7752_15200 [Halopseudomonas sp.]